MASDQGSPDAPHEGSGQTDDASPPRPRMNAEKLETWVDLTIQQAQRRGDFDNLPGAGKPIEGVDKPHDPDWWIKGLVKREKLDTSETLPGTLALRREHATFPDSLLDFASEDYVREYLRDYNARVVEDRRHPTFGPGSPVIAPRVDVEDMVQQWQALRAQQQEQARQRMAADGATSMGAGGQTASQGPPGEVGTPARRRGRWWRRRRRG